MNQRSLPRIAWGAFLSAALAAVVLLLLYRGGAFGSAPSAEPTALLTATLPPVAVGETIPISTSVDLETGEAHSGMFTVLEVRGGELFGALVLDVPEGWELRGSSTPTSSNPYYVAQWADPELAAQTNLDPDKLIVWKFEVLKAAEPKYEDYSLVVQKFEP